MRKTRTVIWMISGVLLVTGVALGLSVTGSLSAQDAEEPTLVDPAAPAADEVAIFTPPVVPRAVVEEVLNEAVADQTVDQAQADALRAALDAKMEALEPFSGRRGPFIWGGPPGLRLHPAPAVWHALHEAFEEGALTVEALRAIVVDMADTLGIAINPDDIGVDGRLHLPMGGLEVEADEALAALDAALDEAVGAGLVTEEAATAILENAQSFAPLQTPRFIPFHQPGGRGPRGPQGNGG